MRLAFSNLLLFLALGACFNSTGAQETTTGTDTNIASTLPNNDTVESTLHSEITSTTPENTATPQQTYTDPHTPEAILVNQISTMPEEPTAESTPPLSTVIEQTSPESVPETTTAQTEDTTMATTIVPVIADTTVIEQATSDAPSTSQYETTVGFTSLEVTSSTEHPTDEITTAAVDLTEDLNPTTILSKPSADTSTESSTTTLASTTQLSHNPAEVYPTADEYEEFASTQFTTATATTTATNVIIEQSSHPLQSSWLLILIVCVAISIALCAGMILLIKRRKKSASRNFGPVHLNGQSKRSKKKKGAEDDTWAGPVNLEAGAECDAEVQEGLLPNNGKQDGDDMVLSTFAALDAENLSDGGVGGDGTKEAKKWEEQEPMLYIDEDVNEEKASKTPAESEKQKVDEKSEEKGMNGGETFCLTTAV
ncbi:hypothetical protein QQF64_024877 [Cirrhinus molitorella]|uniref:Uncharacterized protein n=1 Tax=Cirrhinus molitorella TaxID=172907 RepID=A0ABR3NMH3_9TELE